MNTQLRLLPYHGTAGRPLVLMTNLHDALYQRVRQLDLSGQLELALRLPSAIEQIVDQRDRLAELPDRELELRLVHAERDVDRLGRERARRRAARGRCPECQVHPDHGHLLGCDRGAA